MSDDKYNFVMPGLSIDDMRPADEIRDIMAGFTVDEFMRGVIALSEAPFRMCDEKEA
ncbi:MAG: hypothetical protein ACPG7F_00060 [Aggregatilineales bacterium]